MINMNELTMTATSHLLIGLLGGTGLVLSLVTIWKANQFGDRLGRFMKGIVWSVLVMVCLCAMVLYANSLETIRAFETVSSHVQAAMRGY